MSSENRKILVFGRCRIDAENRLLWHGGEPVPLPGKAVELLSLLVERAGDLVRKEDIWETVWQNSFVEETNLTHNIYLLRKTLKELGEGDLIQTVPRRGYRFTGRVHESAAELVIERHSVTETLIEEITERTPDPSDQLAAKSRRRFIRSALAAAAIFGVAIAALAIYLVRLNPPTASEGDVRSIAVLPLHGLSKNENERTLSMGLTDALISRLGSLGRFAVRPYSGVEKYEASDADALDFGRQLKVDAVLEGSLQSVDDRLRVSVRLFRVADGSQIWSGSFDENETDIFRLQDSLSAQVAQSLTDHLTPQEEQRLAARPTEDLEAYKLYLRGRHAWNKRTPEALWESVRLFQSAIDRDPTFALAHAGLADAYVLLNDYDAAAPEDAYPKARAAAYKALEIDPNLVEPRTTIAYVSATYDLNFAEAEREYRRVIELNPNYATAHQWYGEMLYATKRFAEAEVELRHAADLNPLAPIIASELAVVSFYAGKYDESIERYEKLKQEHPNFPTTYLFTAFAFEQKQMFEQTVANEIVFWRIQGVNEQTLAAMEQAFRQNGYNAYLKEIAEMLEKASQDRGLMMEYRMVHIYARLRDREKTLEWLKRGIERRSASIIKINLDPNFDFLRDDERFKELQRKLEIKL